MSGERCPKVSVVIPTYNRADLLPRAVNSVLAQTFDDYEIIIVDDCSADGTQEVIRRIEDVRVRAFRHSENSTGANARNTGIANAGGEYVAFLDDDDEYLSDALEGLVALMDGSPTEVGFGYGWLREFNQSTGRMVRSGGVVRNGDILEDALAMAPPMGTVPMIARRSALEDVGGFDPKLTNHDDANLVTRMCLSGYHVACLPKVVANTYIEHGYPRYSDVDARFRRNMAASIRAHMKRFAEELDRRPHLYGRLAMYAMDQTHNLSLVWSILLKARRLPRWGVALTLIKMLVWHVSPLRRYRDRARTLRDNVRTRFTPSPPPPEPMIENGRHHREISMIRRDPPDDHPLSGGAVPRAFANDPLTSYHIVRRLCRGTPRFGLGVR